MTKGRFSELQETDAAATMSAREILTNDVRHAKKDSVLAVIITNEDGKNYGTLPRKRFAGAVKVRLPQLAASWIVAN
jgi:hypothetical protein